MPAGRVLSLGGSNRTLTNPSFPPATFRYAQRSGRGGGNEEPTLAPRCGHSHWARCRVLDGYLDEVSIVADRLPLEQQGYFAIPGRNTVCQSKRTACYRDIGGLRLTMHRSGSHQTVLCSTLGNERLNGRCGPRCPPGSLRNVSAVAGIATWDRNEWPR